MADLNVATVMSLSGRVGLVTGGGTGIGFMIAKAFAANGAKVYITGRRLEVLERAAVSVTGMDVTNEENIKAGAQHIEGIDGKVDILVNKSAYNTPSSTPPAGFVTSLRDLDFMTKKLAAEDPFEPETIQNWADIFALNTIAPFFVVRAFQSLLVKGAHSHPQGTSSVINISSGAAKMNLSESFFAYSPTNAALSKLTLVLGTSFAGRNIPIRVNAIEPEVFASEMAPADMLELFKTKPPPGLVAPVPAGRHGTDAEMGMAAVYLAASDYTNGATLRVDGGVTLVNP
ncbi:uncharacterized protein EV420DRAFT_1276524 [Desarmillaria tabescens]|uniref:NAD(P)-binding protein n=1 Tax=Armillaria tabescens TaxID=1929756 RepID=A0AA39JPX7_ARMTA|nr:uncharacterized protein EV420DRAFT_1276524 [Desarmillaria tabescens]KAK0446579.1 hypothetical protein EV420DRAFT_1276524 [Desarmillaria tabescens]